MRGHSRNWPRRPCFPWLWRFVARFDDGARVGADLGHSGGVWGLDGQTVVLGVLAVALAVGLGAWQGTQAGPGAGVLGALAGLIPPGVLAVAAERRARKAALRREQQQVLARYAPPAPASEGEDEG